MPNVTVEELITRIDDQRRDSTDGSVDNSKKFRAITAILEIISARSNFKFAIREKQIHYLAGYTDYNLENTLGITDFKEIHQLRPIPEDGTELDNVQERDFSKDFGRGRVRGQVTAKWVDGAPNLRINAFSDKPKTQYHAMTDYNSNGTWVADTAASDAASVSDDALEFDNGAVSFNITAAQSVNNKATISNSTMTAVDLTDFLNVAHHRIKIFIPALLTLLTSITIRFGSDSTNYYEITITAPADGVGFVPGAINELDFDWGSATKVLNPVITAMDYALITLNYSVGQVNVTGVRITDWWIIYPKRLMLYYFSTSLVRTAAGAVAEGVTALDDEIIIPRRHKETVVEGTLWQVMDQMGTSNSEDSDKHLKFFEYGTEYDPAKSTSKRFGGMRQMMREFGIAVPTEKRKLKVRHRPET